MVPLRLLPIHLYEEIRPNINKNLTSNGVTYFFLSLLFPVVHTHLPSHSIVPAAEGPIFWTKLCLNCKVEENIQNNHYTTYMYVGGVCEYGCGARVTH